MFKIVLDAGHGLYTAGKRCLKAIDPNETREWSLNSRIAEMVEARLKLYDGVEILRVDDRTGATDVPLSARTSKANEFEADFYLSIHHNAGIYGGSGGGIVAYTYTNVGNATKEWQKDLYNCLIKYTGLKGNRAEPLSTANFQVLRQTKMPAVLLELGFMDSTTDTPIILTEDFANQCATAIEDIVVVKGKLTRKTVDNTESLKKEIEDLKAQNDKLRSYAQSLEVKIANAVNALQ